jgi:hypothetical protein
VRAAARATETATMRWTPHRVENDPTRDPFPNQNSWPAMPKVLSRVRMNCRLAPIRMRGFNAGRSCAPPTGLRPERRTYGALLSITRQITGGCEELHKVERQALQETRRPPGQRVTHLVLRDRPNRGMSADRGTRHPYESRSVDAVRSRTRLIPSARCTDPAIPARQR